ncbi:MAG: hypothetical protein SFU85_03080 [Candidatus Methylacidiphilales bacterium]|nr:hypothetical protein [Candidatus Methylacidiphilales bacterium]
MPAIPESNLEWLLLAVFIASAWVGFMALLSWYSGIRALGRTFTRFPRIKGRKHWMVTVWCGTGAIAIPYPFCYTLTLGDDGMYLEPAFFLRPFHHNMRIGWRSVIDCDSSFFFTKIRFVELPFSLTVLGRAGSEIHKEVRRYSDTCRADGNRAPTRVQRNSNS